MTIDSTVSLFPLLGDCAPFPDKDPSGRRPSEMVVLEIDFDATGGNLRFFFSGAWGPTPVADDQDLWSKLGDVAQRKFPQPANKLDESKPHLSKLSFGHKTYRYIVYVLTPKNWQFAQSYVPLTIQKNLINSDIYFEARRVTPSGDIQEIGKGAQDLARVAYFVADGSKAMNDGGGNYRHGLNLNVDLFDNGDHTTLPLIIDPDIRYPGGITLIDPE